MIDIPPGIDKAEYLKSLVLEMDRIESELTRRHRENGIAYYVPNLKQQQAHMSPAKELYYLGGNRSGKTTFAMAEAVMHATGKYHPWYEDSPRKMNRPVKIKIISPKYKEGINDTIEPKIKALLPKKDYAANPRRSPQGYVTHMDISWRDGKGTSTIDFLSQEQSDVSFESFDADIIICDEPLRRGIYNALMRALIDREGYFMCAYTSLSNAWMKEMTDKADGKKIDLIVADIRDNKFDILGNPILKEEAIQRFEEKLTDEEKEIRIHGRYFHLSGLVYKELSDAHIVRKLPDRFITWSSLDPHDRNPHWVIWSAVDATGDVIIYDELVINCGLYDLAKQVKIKEKNMTIHTRVMDPNFGHKPAAVGSDVSVQSQLEQQGVYYIDGIDDEDSGIAMVREYLRYDKSKPIDIRNRPKLYFLEGKCPQTLKAMKGLQYKEWRSGIEDKEENERIQEKHKHASDTIRYLLMARPQYKRPKVYEGATERLY